MQPFLDRALEALYPTEIPNAARIAPLDHPPRYMVGRSIRTVEGEDRQTPVYSRVAVRRGEALVPVLLGHEPKIGAREAEEAMAAAERAFGEGRGDWPSSPVERRIAAVERFAERMLALAEPIGRMLMFEIGKPLPAAKGEVLRSVEYIKDTLDELRRLTAAEQATYSGVNAGTTHFARDVRRPLGKVLCVGPFNYPINEFLTTIIPALLMGNVVIAKTPRFGVLANQLLMEAYAECFPDGAVSLLPGDGRVIIPALIRARTEDVFGQPKGLVDVFAFIGSEGAAHAILSQHPTPSFLHKILGLGAKNQAIVMPGADLEAAASKLVKGALGFNGQRCTAEKIIFVPEGQEGDAFVARLAAKVSALPLGMPWTPGVAITPLPEDTKLETLWAYLTDALDKGARIANEGGGRGCYSIMRPAVLDRVALGMRIYDEEQFGPIVPVVRYRSTDEAVAWQIRSPYGQQAGVFGPAGPARRALVESLEPFVARININDVCQRGPDSFGFTAADKSGFGTLSIRRALESMSRTVILQSQDRAAVEAG
jgi:glyceraldehyde-3-phosphate dehydrogenase (NADP+)